MMLVQGEGALVIQNRAAKIARAKIRVSKIVKQICVPLTSVNQRLVAGDRFFEMTLCVFLVGFGELQIRLSESGRNDSQHAQKNHNCSIRHPERSREIPEHNRSAVSRDSSTTLRFARNDDGKA